MVLQYSDSLRTLWSSLSGGLPSSGDLSLFMQSTRDVELLNAWLPPDIERVNPPEPSGEQPLLTETRPIKTGKLRIRHVLFWQSHHVALYVTGQLVISDQTGTRPLQVINLLNVPVLRSHDDPSFYTDLLSNKTAITRAARELAEGRAARFR